MKKFILVILPLIFLCFLLAKTSFAAPTSPPPTPTSTTSTTILPGPNPGPQIGTPCGNTMCLDGETCVQYPGDVDQHCVPNDFDPTNPKAVGKDVPVECGDTGTFPPNSLCWNKFKNAQTDMNLYAKTCIYEPVVHYASPPRYLHGTTEEQPFENCGVGDGGPGITAPGGGKDECTVAMLVYTDVRDAELGGYGPSAEAETTYSSDFIAQNYLYSSLFGRPLDLSSNYDKDDINNNGGYPTREAYRTYWRLLPANNQANLRSFVLNMAHDDLMLNIKFKYTDSNKHEKEIDFKTLYEQLNKQLIFFWHFPFFRIGCLTAYPVCPEYAQATRELIPKFEVLRNLVRDLNLGPLATAPLDLYESFIEAFGGNLDGPYSAFVPLDFSSTRGYIVKKKDEVEDALYKKYYTSLIDMFNMPRYGTFKPNITNVSRENLPYIGAIYQGLLSPKFGMFPALQPQWIVDHYATPSGISDYKMGNLPSDMPEVKISHKNFMDRVLEEAEAIITDPWGWLSKKVQSFFTAENKIKGYTEKDEDNTDETVREAYVDMKGCPLPVSYHLLAPKTAADAKGTVIKPLDDHHQVISIPGNQLAWSFTPEDLFSMDPLLQCHWDIILKIEVCVYVPPLCPPNGTGHRRDEYFIENNRCKLRKWSVEGTQHGKALTVLNNPKQTDIKDVTVGNDKYSFFKMMLPSGAGRVPDAGIDAPLAKNFLSYSDLGGTVPATAPITNGTVTMMNPAEPINRVNNLAQDSMHILQNCWVVPEDQQNSPRCNLVIPPEASISACTGEAFSKLSGDKTAPTGAGQSYFDSFISPNLTPEVITAYAVAEEKTGVPCEALAGIHFKEGNNNPQSDLQQGAPLNGRSLSDSAIQAATELLGKNSGKKFDTINQLIAALSAYNGGGNSNCQAGGSNSCAPTDRCGQTVNCTIDVSACTCVGGPQPGSCQANCPNGFPYPINYTSCPPAGPGYDDPYVTNLWLPGVNDNMYILYSYECTQTRPYLDARPGTLTVAISLFLKETK